MNARQRSRLINANRGLIFVLTVSGMLMDGLQLADLPCTLAVFVWLWLPLCTRLEAYLLHWIGDQHDQQGSAKTPASIRPKLQQEREDSNAVPDGRTPHALFDDQYTESSIRWS